MARAKIGPNSIIQTIRVLDETYGRSHTAALLQPGGQEHLIDNLPTAMVYEDEFHALIATLVEQLGAEQTAAVLAASGRYTAIYLLQHRIPKLFQHVLQVLPRDAALTLFLMAIGQNAWTFAGSGSFSFVTGKHARIIIANPTSTNQQPGELSQPNGQHHTQVCAFYAGTFEALLQQLIAPDVTIQPIGNQNHPDIRCAYAICFHG
jgi:divinyl protochlorophyllide a 8-vinyl-reductase